MLREQNRISIITVCLNAEGEIGKTLESVLVQQDASFEYLIVDGASTDRTLELANEYLPRFQEKGIACRVVSEKDAGIYDAMNKGAILA